MTTQTTAAEEEANHAELANRDEIDAIGPTRGLTAGRIARGLYLSIYPTAMFAGAVYFAGLVPAILLMLGLAAIFAMCWAATLP